MITFLPYPDYSESARCLDYRRLGKQRIECLQILKGQFPHHPASLMWEGYHYSLQWYASYICEEWVNRGFKDNVMEQIEAFKPPYSNNPPWLGDEQFHQSHRDILYVKDPKFYGGKKGFREVISATYLWPKQFNGSYYLQQGKVITL